MGLTATPRQRGQQRDAEILRLIGQLGYLRVDQVARLACAGRQRVARRRLLRLTQEGRLARFAPGRNEQYVYCLPGKRRDTTTAAHPLAVAEIYCTLVVTCPATVTIETFQPEYEAGDDYRADALLLTTSPERRLAAFWEIDLATEHVPTVVHKVEALAGYHASGAYRQASWWRPGTQVLQVFVAPTTRLAALRPAVTTAAAKVGVQSAVVDQSVAGAQPWAALYRLLLPPPAEPLAARPPRTPLASGARQGPRGYAPAWQRAPAATSIAEGAPASPKES